MKILIPNLALSNLELNTRQYALRQNSSIKFPKEMLELLDEIVTDDNARSIFKKKYNSQQDIDDGYKVVYRRGKLLIRDEFAFQQPELWEDLRHFEFWKISENKSFKDFDNDKYSAKLYKNGGTSIVIIEDISPDKMIQPKQCVTYKVNMDSFLAYEILEIPEDFIEMTVNDIDGIFADLCYHNIGDDLLKEERDWHNFVRAFMLKTNTIVRFVKGIK
jgi:hypothetical protein